MAAPLIVGISGMRGIAGQSLTAPVALRFAAAFGSWLSDRVPGRPTVLVARDGRRGGEAYEHAAIAGLLGAGCDVLGLGVAATPTVGCVASDYDGAVIITASHNPQQWNGLKLLVTDGLPAPAHAASTTQSRGAYAHAPTTEQAGAIIDRFNAGEAALAWRGEPGHAPTYQALPDTAREHVGLTIARAVGVMDPDTQGRLARDGGLGLRLALDAVNCSGATIAPRLIDRLGQGVLVNCSTSGVFPHPPEPTRENLDGPGQLVRLVPAADADAGFAQDPDADRLAVIDERGRYPGEEYTLALCALALLEAADDPAGAVLVANLSTSRMLDDVASRFGARVERTPVGEAHVVERMVGLMAAGERVLLGGEGNGGVIWPAVSFVRDSICGIALIAALLARHRRPLGEVIDSIPAYAIIKDKADAPDRQRSADAVERVAHAMGALGRVDRQDGLRIDLDGEQAWLSVRASNTEPIVRLIAEAPTEQAARALLEQGRAAMAPVLS